MAIAHADAVCQWRENVMDEDEMPPEWMWPFPKEIDRHWANVDEKRKARAKGEDEPELEENLLARAR